MERLALRFPKPPRSVRFSVLSAIPPSPAALAPDPAAGLVPGGTATAAGAQALERLRAWPGERRVAVGLSGGVDSSLTAALLVEAGWQVEGLTLWLMSGKGACCAEGLVDAAGICEQLGVPHHVVDFREHFKDQIVDFLLQGYGAGITPLPCSRCNREVKFAPMLAWAQAERGIGRIATGHYARVRHAAADPLPVPGEGAGRHQLLRGLDSHKDQSYFLYDLPLGTAGPLAAHQPEGEPLHLPARRQKQGCGEGAVHASGKAHRHAPIPRPGPQVLEHSCAGRGGADGCRWVGNRRS